MIDTRGAKRVKTGLMLRLAAVLCVSFVACLPCLAHAQERRLPVLSANLDSLLNFTQFWQWSSEDFEKAYVVKLADPEQPLGLSSSPVCWMPSRLSSSSSFDETPRRIYDKSDASTEFAARSASSFACAITRTGVLSNM
jgi:hypothetical protein